MIRQGDSPKPAVIIITGPLHSGKTTLAVKLVDRLRGEAIRVKGILAPGAWTGSVRSGFDLLDLNTSRVCPFAVRTSESSSPHGMPFTFSRAGTTFGKQLLSTDACRDAGVVFIDEIGKLELAGEGWAPCLNPLLAIPGMVHVWIVRDTLLDSVCKTWNIQPYTVDSRQPDALDSLWDTCRELLQ
jgi:nucleoside-triphosphatase THEP1